MLVRYGIRNEQNLINVVDNKKDCRESLVPIGILPAVCDSLFHKYVVVAAAHGQEERPIKGGKTLPQNYVPALLSVAVSLMKSGWERISSDHTKSESSTTRNIAVTYDGLTPQPQNVSDSR